LIEHIQANGDQKSAAARDLHDELGGLLSAPVMDLHGPKTQLGAAGGIEAELVRARQNPRGGDRYEAASSSKSCGPRRSIM